MKLTRFALPLAASLAGLALVSCSSPTAATTSPSASGSPSASASTSTIDVVASTNVWGDIATKVGGDKVNVTSIIDDPDKDPHEYEASAQNQLALSKAKVVIENGGGYDDFVDTMLASAKNTSATVLNAVTISGKKAASGEELNEHVWYDFPTVEKVIDQLQSSYATIDPASADTFANNAKQLKGSIDALVKKEGDLKATYNGQPASITEPVPLYMLEAIGLKNKTPDAFSEAIEEDSDVAPAVLRATLKLYSDHAVKLLAYNEQTTGAETEAVLKAAKENNIPVVGVTETLPSGEDYVSWMTKNLDAIGAALAK
ncbi:metal ABC transporter solute-binding protein, Zn/Mn family [Micropruina sp.]|uniref:metal ABC transporter solute-binding protein, Zn/Mn family n=1 Tax=Micropruina sp. TaxID=2737536 RepID=UPI0039E345FD